MERIMDDVTPVFRAYREAIRHLWNTSFRPLAEPTGDWDIRDEFDTIGRAIFSSIVLRPLRILDQELSAASAAEPSPLQGFRIVPDSEQGTTISINRDLPRSGYWDYPIQRVGPADVELHLLRFFDFDQLGYRDFEYYEVSIHASGTYPDIVGRVALIDVDHARVCIHR
jgi:hypothetical protein